MEKITDMLKPNEHVLWSKVKKKKNKLKKFFILTNYRWIQKESMSTLDEYLYGILLHADGVMSIDLSLINAVNIIKIYNDTCFVNFFFFVENWGPYVPLLGVEVKLDEFEELLNILKKELDLDENKIISESKNRTWYFRRGYDYKNAFD